MFLKWQFVSTQKRLTFQVSRGEIWPAERNKRAMAGSSAIQKFYDAAKAAKTRASSIVKKEKAAKPLRRLGVGLTGTGAAALAGYADGRFHSEAKSGMYVGPVPVVPVVGGLLAVVGIADVIPGSDYVAGAGFAIANGWLYSKSHEKGLVDNLNAASKGQGV